MHIHTKGTVHRYSRYIFLSLEVLQVRNLSITGHGRNSDDWLQELREKKILLPLTVDTVLYGTVTYP
jgi:hypothetical protein